MRIPLALILLCAAAPLAAQPSPDVTKRLDKVEKELRAVQRKVFPGGAGSTVEPEISPGQPGAVDVGVPATNAVDDVNTRVDALESQLRTLTGQAEENAHRLGQLEAALTELRTNVEGRLGAAEQAKPPAVPVAAPTNDAAADSGEAPAISGDPGEDAYTAGYRLWNEHKYTEAQKTLEAMVKTYPKHKRASFAQNLLGRAYLDGGKPATAAKIFLANYQTNPKGERAPDSLYFLGEALVQLDRRTEACKVYDELQDVYGATMRDWVKQRLPKARQTAKCT